MAYTKIAPGGRELFYVVAAILLGTSLITYLLKFVNLDHQRLLATKTGSLVRSTAQHLFDRIIKVIAVANPLAPPYPPTFLTSRGYLETLPHRSGPRPNVKGITKPIQTTQVPSVDKDTEFPKRLRDLIVEIPSRYPTATYIGRSAFEAGGSITLYARHRVYNKTNYYGEILRASQAEGFIETTLHPSDVKTVIEKGWGQRHPLSGRLGSWLRRLSDASQPRCISGTQVLIYAPRTQVDLEAIQTIINAAVYWVGGIDNRVDDENF